MKDLDFLEIGTCDFDALIMTADESTVGISVEPVRVYLDRLPNPPGVKKINCAVALDNQESTVYLYYIPEELYKENKLPSWMKGCNSINDYHTQHREYGVEHLVQKLAVPAVPIAKLLTDNQVRKIQHLKIDVEGGDCDILQHFFQYVTAQGREYFPKMITFESNRLTAEEKIQTTIDLYASIGYRCHKRTKNNTILVLEDQS